MNAETPDYLNEQAQNVYIRISNKLKGRGLWQEAFSGPLSIASMACVAYVTKARSGSDSDYDLEALRIAAREFLADFMFIPENRRHLAVLDREGLDTELVEIFSKYSSI